MKQLKPRIIEKLNEKEKKGRKIDGVVVESDDEMDGQQLKKEMEKFTRKNYFRENEVTLNARPQSTIHGTLDDEELGSLV